MLEPSTGFSTIERQKDLRHHSRNKHGELNAIASHTHQVIPTSKFQETLFVSWAVATKATLRSQILHRQYDRLNQQRPLDPQDPKEHCQPKLPYSTRDGGIILHLESIKLHPWHFDRDKRRRKTEKDLKNLRISSKALVTMTAPELSKSEYVPW